MIAFDHETFETHTPLKQRSAREQEAAGVSLPYFVDDLDGPINWHMTIMVLTREELQALTIHCRKEAARIRPSEHDNRNGRLDYPATPKEMHAVARHYLINRTAQNCKSLVGYMNGYDNALSKIVRKGIDVEQRQMHLRRCVCALIDTYYPYLKLESAEYLWKYERKTEQ